MAAAKPEKSEEPGVMAATTTAAAQPSNVTELNVTELSDRKSSAEKTTARQNAANEAMPVGNAGLNKNAGDSELEKNPTKRCVDEVVALMGDVHELREEIMARGIPFHTINVLVELGVHDKLEEQANMRKTALETSQKQHGPAAITAEKLDEHLETLVNLEKDLGHVRRLGRDQGLDMSSINYLTMIIRQNPGDGGEKMINTFLGYAMACDIPLHNIEAIYAAANSGPKSVLPDIARDDEPDIAAAARKRLLIDMAIGCALALLALSLLT